MSYVLHAGDYLDPVHGMPSLADKSVDVVITDPPYSEHVHSKQWIGHALTTDGAPRVATAHTGLGFDPITPDIAARACREFARIAKRWVAVFCDLEGAALWIQCGRAAGFDYVRTCIWDKVDGAPQFTGDRPANGAEAFVLLHLPGKKQWNGGGKRNVYRYAVNEERGDKPHPSTKPLRLMEALVRDFTDAGELILDPFAGSGTTGVAALRLGRMFVGWERDEKYHARATARLRGERPLPDGFIDERQGALF